MAELFRFSLMRGWDLQTVCQEILQMNEISQEYGLVLTESQAKELAETRVKALSDNGRLEIGTGTLAKIISEFCNSSFMNEENYAENLNELVETFYYFKTQMEDTISDNDLLRIMKDFFENSSYGGIDLLQGRELETLLRYIKAETGIPYEEPEDEDEDE